MNRHEGARGRFESGMTIPELLVAISILGIGLLAAFSSYQLISKSLEHSKGRTLASNQAQEQIERLKGLSYYNLLVTTSSYSDARYNPAITYDTINYPVETLIVGGITFQRATRIDFALQNGNQISLVPAAQDTGLKQISVYLLWQEGGIWKSTEAHDLIANSSAQSLTGTLTGAVNDDSALPVVNALIQVLGHPTWQTFSDATGHYVFQVSPGSYTLTATARGYFQPSTDYLTVNSGASVVSNFTMVKMSSGTAIGLAYRQDHVVISQVVTATDTATGFNVEYVELYNPTPHAITMGSGDPALPGYIFKSFFYYYDPSGNIDYSLLSYIHSTIPAYGYYLISNKSTIHVGGQTISADAIYSGPASSYTNGISGQSFLAPLQMMTASDAGGLILQISYPVLGWQPSSVSWSNNAAGHPCPNVAKEFACMDTLSGLTPGDSLLRKTDPYTSNPLYGRAYDSHDNSQDWIESAIVQAPSNAAHPAVPSISGTPATGAAIEFNDFLSNAGVCQGVELTPGHPAAYCSFQVPSIATGAWTMTIFSTGTFGNYSANYSNIVIAPNVSTGVPNGSTNPQWIVLGTTTAFLTSATTDAFVTGHIYDVGGNPLAGIKVIDGAGGSAISDGNGRYFLDSAAGAASLIANPNDSVMNHFYVSSTLPSQILSASQFYDGSTWGGNGSDFTLSESGSVQGFFQTPSGMPLPNMGVTATNASGNVLGHAVSDNTGFYYFINFSTGTYTIQADVDPAETATPGAQSISLTVSGATVSASTITVTNGLSQITGQALLAATHSPITTGTLIIATTANIPGALPPAMNGASGPLCSPCYYQGSSDGNGLYTLSVRGDPLAYNVYGWYTNLNGGAPIVTKTGPYSIAVSTGGQVVTQNLSW